MDKHKELEKLKNKIQKVYDENISHLDIQKKKLQNDIEKQESSELIGKTFVYKDNSFSCPSKKSEYWNVYLKVVECIDSSIRVITVEKNSQGNIEIQTEERWNNHLYGYVPCSKSVFERYFKKYSEELKQFVKRGERE